MPKIGREEVKLCHISPHPAETQAGHRLLQAFCDPPVQFSQSPRWGRGFRCCVMALLLDRSSSYIGVGLGPGAYPARAPVDLRNNG